MTVLDCIKEYESLGETIFEKPRFFFTLRFGLGNRTKYDAMRAKKAFQDLTDRRNEKICETRIRTIFPSQRGLCRTLVSFPVLCIHIVHNKRIRKTRCLACCSLWRVTIFPIAFVFDVKDLPFLDSSPL